MVNILSKKPSTYSVGVGIGDIFKRTKNGYRRERDGKLLTEQEYEDFLCSTAQVVVRIPAWQE